MARILVAHRKAKPIIAQGTGTEKGRAPYRVSSPAWSEPATVRHGLPTDGNAALGYLLAPHDDPSRSIAL